MYTLEERQVVLETQSLEAQTRGRWHPMQKYATGSMANVALGVQKPKLIQADDGKTCSYTETRLVQNTADGIQLVGWQECEVKKDDKNTPYLAKTIEYSLL